MLPKPIKINNFLWEIPRSARPGMRVPARFYASEIMLSQIYQDHSLEQLINVATLPGIQKYSLAMPDIHEGYGFPIGGVAAIDAQTGVISPGGVGYDINCGVRLLQSQISYPALKDKLVNLANQIQRVVPSGVGRGGRLKLDKNSMDKVLKFGAKHVLEMGYAEEEDLENCENFGSMPDAAPNAVSPQAKKRGADQCGTLGSGNHFLEIQKVEKIFNEEVAKIFGLFPGQITVMLHSGSRGLGHQVCTDYVRLMQTVMSKYNLKLPDRELACAPFNSPEAEKYFKAMAAAANFAWANRLLMTYLIRQAWTQVLGQGSSSLKSVYDVSHNIAKIETYANKKLIVHRKGATRAFGPHHPDLPKKYHSCGQPIIIPGSMATASYVLVGTKKAEQETFGSVCHGAGRRLSRTGAKKELDLNQLQKDLKSQNIIVRCDSPRGLLEEAPSAYKDIHDIVDVVEKAGLAQKVVRLKPLVVIKGGG